MKCALTVTGFARARAGEQGPEIWYKLKSQLFLLRESSLRESSLREFQIFDMLVKGFSEVLAQQLAKTIADNNPGWLPPNAELTMTQIIGEIMKRAEGLKEKERELSLKQTIQTILKQATSDVLIMVRIETLLAKRAGPSWHSSTSTTPTETSSKTACANTSNA